LATAIFKNKALFSLPVASKWARLFLWFFVSALAATQVGRYVQKGFHAEQAVDFRNIYVGSEIWKEGGNAYSDSELKSHWKKIAEKEKLPPNKAPGLPDLALLYPPQALIFFSIFTSLDYSNAVILFQIILALQIPVMAFILMKITTKLSYKTGCVFWVLTILSCKMVCNSIEVGQPSLILINLVFMALYFTINNYKQSLTFILFFFAMIKPTVGLLCGSGFVFNRKYFLLAGMIVLLSLSLFIAMGQRSITYFSEQLDGLQHAYSTGTEGFPFTFDAMSNTNLESLYVHVVPELSGINWLKISFVILAIVLFVLHRNYFRNNKIMNLGFWAACSLVFVYHKYYDLLILIPVAFLFIVQDQRLLKFAGYWFWFHLILPYNALGEFGISDNLKDSLQMQNSLIPFVFFILICSSAAGFLPLKSGKKQSNITQGSYVHIT